MESDQMENYINRQASDSNNEQTRIHKSAAMTIIVRVASVVILMPNFHQLFSFALGRHGNALIR